MNLISLIFPGLQLASSAARDDWSERSLLASSRRSRDS